MASELRESCPFPQEVLDSLEPYLKTRQETLKIRRTLTAYLDSLIEFPEHGGGALPTLIAASNAVGVKHIPSTFTGIRRDYLRALQSNIAARRQYTSTVEKISTGQEY